MKKWLLPLSILLTSAPVMGSGLVTPLGFDSANILPKGIRTFRYNGISSNVNDRFNAQGIAVPAGEPFNTSVTFGKLIDSQDSDLQKGLLSGFLQSSGQDPNAIAGSTTGAVNVNIQGHVPVFAMGMTRRWTAAVVVPILRVRTNIDTGFVASQDFQNIANTLTAENKQFKAEEVQQKSNQAIADDLASKGYRPLSESNGETTLLGDIRLVNKLQVRKKKSHAIALVSDLVLPTGREADINKLVDVPGGDGQFDLGIGAVTEFYISKNFTTWIQASYTWQISDTVARRVPISADERTSADIDPQIQRDLGDIFYSSFGGALRFGDGFVIRSQYTFQRKGRDQFRGGAFSSERYELLAEESNQVMHAIQVGLGYSTISKFRRKQFPIPLDFNINAGQPISGKNITKDPTVNAEMAIYF